LVIRHVGPLSCAKIFGVLYATMGLVFGCVLSLVAMAGGLAGNAVASAAGIGAVSVGVVIALPIVYGTVGFLMTLLLAWLYNVAAAAVGGIEVDLE
jgi:hypothetical protein